MSYNCSVCGKIIQDASIVRLLLNELNSSDDGSSFALEISPHCGSEQCAKNGWELAKKLSVSSVETIDFDDAIESSSSVDDDDGCIDFVDTDIHVEYLKLEDELTICENARDFIGTIEKAEKLLCYYPLHAKAWKEYFSDRVKYGKLDAFEYYLQLWFSLKLLPGLKFDYTHIISIVRQMSKTLGIHRFDADDFVDVIESYIDDLEPYSSLLAALKDGQLHKLKPAMDSVGMDVDDTKYLINAAVEYGALNKLKEGRLWCLQRNDKFFNQLNNYA